MKYALRLTVHMLIGGILFSVLLGILHPVGFLLGAALGFMLFLFLSPLRGFDNSVRRSPPLRFCAFTASRIFYSSLHMIRLLFSGKPLSASVRKEASNAGPEARIIVSNCITLTPGTITLEENDREYTILCMNPDGNDTAGCFEEQLAGGKRPEG